jgi:type IV pilus assembly protein PilQ
MAPIWEPFWSVSVPKLTVVNNQEAKLQIGQRLSYNVATTTQTTTIQSVQFLEVGIVLTVQPSIADDGQILMSVLPKVSGGKINQTSGLPEEETTEVSTTVLMPDGGGMIIGGLIKDETVNNVANVAGLGRIPGLGMLFRRKSDLTRRNEIIVALVAHVVPDIGCVRPHEHCELQTTLPSYASQSLGQSFMIDSQGSFDETYLESSPVESVTAPE